MGTNLLPDRADATTIDETWYDLILQALSGDLVPRNASCVPGDLAASLGTAALPWKRIWVASGGWKAGDIKKFHSYNGALALTNGWMKCDGRIITQANYDTEHGAGAWAAAIGDSPLSGKYLPDFTARFPIGKATTSQDGAVAITPVGNAGNVRSLSHNHTWYKISGAPGTADSSFNSAGTATTLSKLTKTGGANGLMCVEAGQPPGQDLYTGPSLSSFQSIQPESIEVIYCMRVI